MKYFISILLLVAACENRKGSPTPIEPGVPGTEFGVEKLFEVEGCNVYSFSYAGHTRVLTTCKGSVETNVSCGKNCTRPDVNETK